MEQLDTEDETVALYQLKVALYIASHLGHVDLAVSMVRYLSIDTLQLTMYTDIYFTAHHCITQSTTDLHCISHRVC